MSGVLFSGIHEVVRKSKTTGKLSVGYFTDADLALAAFVEDEDYEAVWASLNPLPRVIPGGAVDKLRPAANRSNIGDYQRITSLLIDYDPIRATGDKKASTTDAEKATGLLVAGRVREFLVDQMHWPRPFLADSGNSYHHRFALDLPADQATQELMRTLLAGLAAKFNTAACEIDTGNHDACRICKLYGTWARKGANLADRPWRKSGVLEVPERDIELPAKDGELRRTVRVLDFEPVPRERIEAAIAQLPANVASGLSEMSENTAAKLARLRAFMEEHRIAILSERTKSQSHFLNIVCPWESEHGSETVESSTAVWYSRGGGYGFRCFHSGCEKRSWATIWEHLDPHQVFSWDLDGLPGEISHSEIAHYFIGLPESHNHVNVYDAGKMRATFVGTRWDLIDQSNRLLMRSLQPICDRLRWDMPEPAPGHPDPRKQLHQHPFRLCTLQQVIPQLDGVRMDQFDANGYLLGLPGGKVADLRDGKIRDMKRGDYLTRRLRIMPVERATPVYNYFLRSISSVNDAPADEDWLEYLTLFLGYCLIGGLPYQMWPLWEGNGGNGKTELAKLMKFGLDDFCEIVRWSELAKDERGGDNTFKRLAFKLIGCRVAIVEEVGDADGHRKLETSIVKQLTGGGKLKGANLYKSEVEGEIQFKMPTLFNRPPMIDDDPAFRRRVELLPFRASFDEKETSQRGRVALAMERKQAPDHLKAHPEKLEELLRAEMPGILFRWMQSARLFIAGGETLPIVSAVRDATDKMFLRVNPYADYLATRLEYGADYEATFEALNQDAERVFREKQRYEEFNWDRFKVEIAKRGDCREIEHTKLERKRGYRGCSLKTQIVGV